MARDMQRQKVYNWENSQSWGCKTSYLTQDQCKEVIKKLDKIFKRKTELKFKNIQNGVSYARGKNLIAIQNKWARNYEVLLHEYAHIITPQKVEAHGPEFVSNFCMLLSYLHPEQPTLKELAKSLNERNIRFVGFERSDAKKRLSKRIKPFPQVAKEFVPLPKKVVKKRIHPKQKCKDLLEQYDWLHINKVDDELYRDFGIEIDVYDKTLKHELDWEECRELREFTVWSWKEAYERALKLIHEHHAKFYFWEFNHLHKQKVIDKHEEYQKKFSTFANSDIEKTKLHTLIWSTRKAWRERV